MKVLITNQNATNKGDRAVLFFLLRELVNGGIREITVSTTTPYYWADFRAFAEGNIRFIPFGWRVSSRKHRKPGFGDRVASRLRRMAYEKVFYPLMRKAALQGRCPGYLRLFCSHEYWDALTQADLVIGTGGHRITTLLARDAVYPSTFDMMLALMRNKPLLLWSQSIGPFRFHGPENRRLVEKLLAGCWRILIRDEGSAPELQAMGIPPQDKRVSMTGESVFGLFDLVPGIRRPSQRKPIMGVSVYMAQRRTPEQARAYYQALAAVVDHAAEQGYLVRFFPMEIPDVDHACIQGVIDHCRHKEACSIVEGLPETPEHMRMVSECRMFVGHKTHSVVFALTMGTPVLAIAYHKKTENFMNQFELGEYCVPDSKLDGATLVRMFDSANTRLDEIHAQEMTCACRAGMRVRQDLAKVIAEAQAAGKPSKAG